jgi:hypothetical protein
VAVGLLFDFAELPGPAVKADAAALAIVEGGRAAVYTVIRPRSRTAKTGPCADALEH